MRTPFVAGNWKMNKTIAEARDLVAALAPAIREIKGVEKVFCPPFLALPAVAELLKGTDIGVGAQNMYWKAEGAHTGEVAPGMVAEVCKYVILGHSERRARFGDTDETVREKTKAALTAGLTPIVCVGETEKEYLELKTAEVVSRQVRENLKELVSNSIPATAIPTIVVAYEPVWAIGTGHASSAENAQSVIGGVVRPALVALYGEATAQAIRILYGGSVTAANAKEIFSQPDIDGALVGGASLKEEFVAINHAAAK